ncbi:meiosis expressed protein 1 protein -like protein, partial [Chelydra serpentina]
GVRCRLAPAPPGSPGTLLSAWLERRRLLGTRTTAAVGPEEAAPGPREGATRRDRCFSKISGGVPGAMASADIKPKSISRAKKWSDEIENLYRFQQAGYRDEIEYKQVKQVDMVDRWPETGFVKKLQRRDNTFYYYNKQRECEDKEVHKVKVYAY